MNEQNIKERALLSIKKELDAPRSEVFSAFTRPELMSQWFFAFPKGHSEVEVDLRVGGSYRIKMIPEKSTSKEGDCGCNDNPLYGEYLEIDPPNRLVFTWINDGMVDYSVVTLEFEAIGESKTLLSLTHEVPVETVEAHRQGWTGCMDNLESFVLKTS